MANKPKDRVELLTAQLEVCEAHRQRLVYDFEVVFSLLEGLRRDNDSAFNHLLSVALLLLRKDVYPSGTVAPKPPREIIDALYPAPAPATPPPPARGPLRVPAAPRKPPRTARKEEEEEEATERVSASEAEEEEEEEEKDWE
jgi:type IV secretory pathway VirB10-like protein